MIQLSFKEYLDKEGLDTTKDQKVIEYLDNNQDKVFRYLITGKVGTGKTLLAKKLCWWKHSLFSCLSVHRLLNFMASDINQLFEDVHSIIIDDIGSEDEKDAMKVANAVILFLKILELNNNTGFIITTNLNSEEIRNRYGDRFFDRIIGQLTILCLNPPSYRKAKAEIIK
ncbi:MAG: AAA family ATPase [Candidatus Cloacimonas acidaminovorans]|nr:AAA family ATPase [Candidatus Cloacimonas acidaminovorans]